MAINEPHEFFKRAHGKKEASPYEFDLVINRDFIDKPMSVVEIVATAYWKKFAEELGAKEIARVKSM